MFPLAFGRPTTYKMDILKPFFGSGDLKTDISTDKLTEVFIITIIFFILDISEKESLIQISFLKIL